MGPTLVRNVERPSSIRRLRAPLSWLVLVVALALTGVAWRRAVRDVEEEGRGRFDHQVRIVSAALREHIASYETILRSAASFVAIESPPTRAEWTRFAKGVDLAARYPNVVGLVFAPRVESAALADHEAAVRASGLPDYTVRPRTPHEDHFPVVYIEPVTPAHLRAVGTDLLHETQRRIAGERARDTGTMALTAPIQLVQDADTELRPAVAFIYPVYRQLPDEPTELQRREALAGFVTAAIRIEPLLREIVTRGVPGVTVAAYDGDVDEPLAEVPPRELDVVPLFERDVRLDLGGRHWRLRFTSAPAFEATLHHEQPVEVLAVGLLLSVLLFAAMRMQGLAEARSFALARAMTAKLRDREARLQAILDSEPECVKTLSLDGRVLQMNPAGVAMVEAQHESQVLGRSIFDLVHPDDRDMYRQLHDRVAAGAVGRLTFRVIGLRGGLHWMETTAVGLRGERGAMASVLSVTRDITDAKRAEDLLLRTTAVLEAIFRAIPDLFFLIDADGKILDYRGGGEADLYVPPAQFLGRRFEDVLPADVADRLIAGLADVRATRKALTIEYALTTSTGDAIFEARLLPIEPDQVVVVARNITERTRAQDALRETEERYRRIVETAMEGIWILDAEHRTTYVNPRMAAILHCEPREVVGRSLYDFLDEDGKRLARNGIESDPRRPSRFEDVKYVRPDGTEFWAVVSTRPFFDDDGAYAGVLGMIIDVTDRRTAEGAHRDAQSLMTSIIEHSPSAIFVKDAQDLRFVHFNRASEQLFGYRREEMIGKSDYDFFPASADFFTSKDREVLATGRLLEIPEETIQTRTKGLRYLRTIKVPIADDAGQPQYLLGIADDITERKKLEAQLRQSQKMEAIGTLAGGIAHDFNNILTSILGFGELARADSQDNAQALDSIDNVLEAGQRAKSLVEQLVAFSRQQEPVRQGIDPGGAVAAALKLVRAALPTSISIRADIAHKLPLVLADTTQIHQLVMNLATNAAHAMGYGQGELDVALHRTTVTRDQAATQLALSPGEYVCLVVRDCGQGMDAATVERIFDPFFTTKDVGHGTGLGLSVVHGIVQSHGGAIVVHSTPGAGTTIEVYLPIYEGPTSSSAPAEANGVPRGRGQHILFVDDEAPLADLGRSMLESLGYRVTSFSDPVAAASMFRATPDGFDLVVTDLTMPSLSGTELAEEVWRVRPGMPILLDTGFIGGMSVDAARAAGLRGVLVKPYTLGTLGRAVHQALTPDV